MQVHLKYSLACISKTFVPSRVAIASLDKLADPDDETG
jgi:hypothetical protein